jgi:hypothetical protein
VVVTESEKVEHLRRALQAVAEKGRRDRFVVDEVLTSSPPQNPGAYYCMVIAEDALRAMDPCPACGELLGSTGNLVFSGGQATHQRCWKGAK